MDLHIKDLRRLLRRPNVGAASELRSLRVIKIGHPWIDRISVSSSWLLIGFVFVVTLLPLPERARWDTRGIIGILVIYSVYVVTLEVLSRTIPGIYDLPPARVSRILINILTVSGLIYLSSGADSYFWCLLALPLFQANIYLRRAGVAGVYILTFVLYWLVSLSASATPASVGLLLTNSLTLLLLAGILYWLFGAARESRTQEYEVTESLRATALAIAAQLDEQALLDTIIQRAVDTLRATGSGIYKYNSTTEELTVVADRGGKRSIQNHTMRKGEGMAGRVVASGKPMRVDDYGRWEWRCPDLEPNLFHAVVEVPLTLPDRIIGVLYVTDEKESRTFSERDEDLLTLLASHAAIAINNASIFNENKRSIAQLKLLDRVSSKLTYAVSLAANLQTILQEALETIGVKDGSIMIFDPKSEELEILAWIVNGKLQDCSSHRKLRPGQGIAGGVAVTRHPINCTDTTKDERFVPSVNERDLRSILSVPIITNAKLLCIINADSTESGRFTEKDAKLLSILGSHVGTMIESLRLREVALTLSTLPLPEVYLRVVESAFTLTGAEVATLFLKDVNNEVARVAVYPPTETVRNDPPRPDGLTNQILRTGQHVIIDDAQSWPGIKPELKTRGIRSIIGVPLTGRLNDATTTQSTIGVLFVSTRTPRKFGASERQILESLAETAGNAIIHAGLHDAVANERDLQQNLLASAFDAIIAIDNHGLVTEFNPSAEKILGYSRKEVLKQDVTKLYRNATDARKVLSLLRDEKNKGRLINHYTYARHEQGQLIPIRLSASILDSGSVGFFRDQTEIENMRQHLKNLLGLLATGQAVTDHDDSGLFAITDLHSLLRPIGEGIIDTLQCDVLWIYYYDKQKGDFLLPPLKLPIDAEGSDELDKELLPFVREIIEQGEIRFIPEIKDDGSFSVTVRESHSFSSVAAGLLRAQGKPVGAMICGYVREQQFQDEEEQVTTRVLMGDAAIAIEHWEIRRQVTALFESVYKMNLNLTSDAKFETKLKNVLNYATEHAGAQYGAIGIISPTRAIQPFIHFGVDSKIAKKLKPPEGRGLLRKLLEEDEVINESDIQQHDSFTGFGDPRHPKITSFLGMPIILNGETVGNVYLGNKRSTASFDDNDEGWLRLWASYASAIVSSHYHLQVSSTREAITLATALLSELREAASETWSAILEELRRLENGDLTDQQLEALEGVKKEVGNLEKELANLYSGIEKGISESVPFDQLLRDIQSKKEISKGIVRVSVTPICSVRGNDLLLRLAWRILVENATRAISRSGRAGNITITGLLGDGYITGTIKHNGKGVPEDFLPDLFNRPIRHSNGRVTYGAFIVGVIMRSHKGGVRLVKSDDNETTIEYWLPAAE